jgi:aprataxin
MSSKHKRKAEKSLTKDSKPPSGPFDRRNGLGAYIAYPESFPPSRVIYHNADFVVINDLYPKSSVHLLLIPRDPTKILLHPFEAFEDADFLAKVQTEIKKLRKAVASELRRRYGTLSTQDRARNEAMESEDPPDKLPEGRDWEKEVISGVHAHPSMNHLHVHVLSVDRYSECLRHRKHYNSFNTPFLIDVEDFPLAQSDDRRRPGRERYLESDMWCWNCGKNYNNKFTQLKKHLEGEFEEWKRR